jgi:hypothetical protein
MQDRFLTEPEESWQIVSPCPLLHIFSYLGWFKMFPVKAAH